MFRMKAEYDFSHENNELISLDVNSTTLKINEGNYEELIIKLTDGQLQELCQELNKYYLDYELLDYEAYLEKAFEDTKQKIFNELYDEGYGDQIKEKQWELEEKLEEAESYIIQLESKALEQG